MPEMPAGCDTARIDTSPRTVLVVDDHPTFRANARRMLDAEGFAVVGEAPDGPSALLAVAALDPDVVVLDVQLPGLDGFEVAERLATAAVRTEVVLVSTRSATDLGPRLTRAPVRGFISKSELSGAALAAVLDAT
jgi:two-component system response regulator EvgA